MRYPSINTIMQSLKIDRAQARAVRGVLDGTISPDSYKSVQDLIRASWHRPGVVQRKLTAINEILEAHGVEHQRAGSGARSPAFEYVNMGDGYVTTVVWVGGPCPFRVCCWAHIVERGNYA